MPPSVVITSAVSLLILFLQTLNTVQGHTQCLDFGAPFKPDTSLSFCPEYTDLGCCGNKADQRLQEENDYIKSQVTSSDWTLCQEYIRVALCQRCSPYAAHIYGAEDGKSSLFPGLCTSYCEEFHDKCRQIVWFLDPKLATFTILGSKKWFCNRVKPSDEDYCYPDVLTKFKVEGSDLLDTPSLTNNTGPPTDKLAGKAGQSNTKTLTRTSTSVTASMDVCLCLEPIKEDLANPLFARPAMDGSGRVFVIEQIGRVHIYEPRKNQWKKELFLDWTSKAFVTVYPGDERGLLGIALHPDFVNNRRFFLFYSMLLETGDIIPPFLKKLQFRVKFKVRISEMKAKDDNPNEADTSSEKVILEIMQPFANHNGGEMFFGPDGYLYTFHGDGGAAGDPLKAGQNMSLLLGKVLRLDVDSDPSKPYTIPADNPFVDVADARPEIYALGVRNIWRCGIDRGDRVTGVSKGILCGDVGQSKYEEIDLLKKGANYGWNSREGFECFRNELCGEIGDEELPVTAYDHTVGKSICGGVFYRGCQYPALDGQYIYGDYTSKRLFSLTEAGGDWTNKDVNLCSADQCQGHLRNEVKGKIMSFGEDEDGEIYLLTSPLALSHVKRGSMFKIVDPSARNDPSGCLQENADRRVPLPKRSVLIKSGNEVTE